MWEIKKVNIWDYKQRPWTVWNSDPFYLWCLIDDNGNIRGESEGFAGHDKNGKIIFGDDKAAVMSLLPIAQDRKQTSVRAYGPFEGLKPSWYRVTPIDENGENTEVWILEDGKWILEMYSKTKINNEV